MSVTTLAAARIYMGQLNNQTGENSQLSFEKFPYSGFSKVRIMKMHPFFHCYYNLKQINQNLYLKQNREQLRLYLYDAFFGWN